MSKRRVLSIAYLLTLSLTLTTSGMAEEIQVPLDYNFNGMTHPGESGMPDAADGFRSISDRSLDVNGGATAFGDLTSPNSGLTYDVVDVAGALDVLHLGNRNTVINGAWAFDPVPDGDDIGIQPTWLPDPDQTAVSTGVPGLPLDAGSQIGILYQISDGGGDFDVTLRFSDTTSVTVTLNGPDWFGPFGGTPDPPGAGVLLQQNIGEFDGTQNVDSADAGPTLLVTEAVIDAAELLLDLGFDVDGKTLTSLDLGNRSNNIGGYAVLALTVIAAPQVPVVEIPTLRTAGLLLLAGTLALIALTLIRRSSNRFPGSKTIGSGSP